MNGRVDGKTTIRGAERTGRDVRGTVHSKTGDGMNQLETQVKTGNETNETGPLTKHDETGTETVGTEMPVDWGTTGCEDGWTERKNRASNTHQIGKTGRKGSETSEQQAWRWGSSMLSDHSNKLN